MLLTALNFLTNKNRRVCDSGLEDYVCYLHQHCLADWTRFRRRLHVVPTAAQIATTQALDLEVETCKEIIGWSSLPVTRRGLKDGKEEEEEEVEDKELRWLFSADLMIYDE